MSMPAGYHIASAQPRAVAQRNGFVRLEAVKKRVDLLKLKGGRRRQRMVMTVDDRWRIFFEFRAGDAHEVEIVVSFAGRNSAAHCAAPVA